MLGSFDTLSRMAEAPTEPPRSWSCATLMRGNSFLSEQMAQNKNLTFADLKKAARLFFLHRFPATMNKHAEAAESRLAALRTPVLEPPATPETTQKAAPTPKSEHAEQAEASNGDVPRRVYGKSPELPSEQVGKRKLQDVANRNSMPALSSPSSHAAASGQAGSVRGQGGVQQSFEGGGP